MFARGLGLANTLLKKIDVALRLGSVNVLRVLFYRATIATGTNAACRIKADLLTGEFYGYGSYGNQYGGDSHRVNINRPVTRVFGRHEVALDGPPYDWFLSVVSQKRFKEVARDWWRIGDFNNDVGDIKGIWEISRFSWVPILALSASRGNAAGIRILNAWLSDWCLNNPAYKGPNWKCGQETSIRVLNLALGALVLRQANKPSAPLCALIEASLRRVAATRIYALAQDNNHGTSEGAGLFVGGEWLASLGSQIGKRYGRTGRKQLERLVRRLINDNGGFSQYSINYHRVTLDTLVIIELWRREFGLPKFSEVFYRRCDLATKWLENFVDAQSSDAPNLGSNDGAHLLEFLNPEYRNYRFSVQLASVVFGSRLAFGMTDNVVDALAVLRLAVPKEVSCERKNFLDDEAGFACIRRPKASAFVRFPRFRFRPGHADGLHVDLWVNGRNVLIDGGTYSYNCDGKTESYFMGVESHNTIQFDDRDQMQRLNRFLYGGWPKQCVIEEMTEALTESTLSVGYCDFRNASHFRRLALTDQRLVVTDRFNGFGEKAVLRWRLGRPGWVIRSDTRGIHVRNDTEGMSLQVATELSVDRADLVRGYCSRYYGEMEEIQVLEVEVSRPGRLVTEIAW